MFFYSDPVPLVITSSADTITIITDTNTTLAGTVNITAGGTGIETVTVTEVSDPSGQFTRSPTSFFLTGSGATQVFTVTFNAGSSPGTYNAIYNLTGRSSTKTINVTGIANTPAPPPPVPSPTPSPIPSPTPSPIPSPIPSPTPSPIPSPIPSPMPGPGPGPGVPGPGGPGL